MTKPTLQDLIASTRGDEPTPAQLRQLEHKLAPLLPPVGGGGGGGHGGGAAGGGVALKWIAAGVVAVGGAVAVQQVVAHRSRPTVPAPQIAVAPPPAPAPDDAALAPTPELAPPPVITPPAHRTPEVSLSAEAALLDQARRAIQRGDSRAALATCEVHAKKFVHGSLREERERIAIEALVALGRRDDAQARARRFDHAFPNSVQSERIHALLRAR
ncbi:MAG: hypothetical protein ABI678_10775 [Kofleriaceae bacterium]